MPTTSPAPVLVLLHGFLESPDIWPEFVGEHFAECRVLTPALPGYGAAPANNYSLEAMSRRPDRRPVLGKATYPVLFIADKDDRAVLPAKTHEESLLPDHCTVLWLAGVGHLGFIERPAETRRAGRQRVEAAFHH